MKLPFSCTLRPIGIVRIALGVLFAMTCVVNSAHALPAGLVASYSANGNASDGAGTNDGTFTGTYVPGVTGQAFDVAPSTQFTAPDTGLPTGHAARTVSCWLDIQSDPASLQGVHIGYGDASVESYFLIGYFNYAYGSYAANQVFLDVNGWSFGGSVLSLNQWYYVAVTYNGAGSYAMYVNGTLVNSVAGPALTTVTSAGGATVAEGAGFSASTGNAYVDNLRVYNSALNTSQIGVDYTTTTLPEPFGLLPGLGVLLALFARRRAGTASAVQTSSNPST